MAIANHFYHATTRKYIAIFGSIFNKLSITRDDNDGVEQQRLIVPIAYGPWQKFLVKLTQDPVLDKKTAITLPRMSFEILAMTYDGTRKVGSLSKFKPELPATMDGGRAMVYAPAPYNLEFNLTIMTKYSEDGTKIIEQILPFFKPEYTVSANLIDGLPPFDIPLILNSVSLEDVYEGDFETRRVLMWTLSFTMKCYYFGPIRDKKVIKFVDVRTYDTINQHPDAIAAARVTTQPGLTEDGEPTTDINQTIPYEEIDVGDDWGVITMIQEDYIDDE